MKQPWVATASDGGVAGRPATTVPHPRSYGTFPRKIGRYAIEDRRRSRWSRRSAAPAACRPTSCKLTDRGYLKPGYFADVWCSTRRRSATRRLTTSRTSTRPGVKWLFVNGKAEVANGEHKPDVLAGKALRHKSVDLPRWVQVSRPAHFCRAKASSANPKKILTPVASGRGRGKWSEVEDLAVTTWNRPFPPS